MKLEDEEFDAYRTAIKVRQEISPDFSVFAFLDQKIIGFLDVFPRKGYPAVGFVTFIYLLPVFRRQGLGKKLEKYALDLLKKYKCSHFELNVFSKNLNALKFYEKHDWKIISQKDGFYRMKKEPGITQ